ncbi:MAG: DUF1211 domain-containing protein [Hyphomicrobiales bacterium]|nr:DUF1211 domain-containing protein [Hyphomicrobiales bacterium]MDE2115106.1 DUF1211 domain-containing protein [Hyphomicrobiales bacterium]
MEPGRLEAFSDGVLAIIITIMVLELKVPHTSDWAALLGLAPKIGDYVLSFVYIGIYWNNHHHFFQAVKRVTGATLWANLHLLFWLSLVPLGTGWMSETDFAPLPVAAYGFLLLMAAIAYFILTQTLIAEPGRNTDLQKALGRDYKGMLSPLIYIAGIAAAPYSALVSLALYALVALIWLVPDRRIEAALNQ